MNVYVLKLLFSQHTGEALLKKKQSIIRPSILLPLPLTNYSPIRTPNPNDRKRRTINPNIHIQIPKYNPQQPQQQIRKSTTCRLNDLTTLDRARITLSTLISRSRATGGSGDSRGRLGFCDGDGCGVCLGRVRVGLGDGEEGEEEDEGAEEGCGGAGSEHHLGGELIGVETGLSEWV